MTWYPVGMDASFGMAVAAGVVGGLGVAWLVYSWCVAAAHTDAEIDRWVAEDAPRPARPVTTADVAATAPRLFRAPDEVGLTLAQLEYLDDLVTRDRSTRDD